LTAAARPAHHLSELAQIHGVQVGYTAQDGRRVRASDDTLRAILAALGHPVDDERSIDAALAEARAAQRAHPLEPVLVYGDHGTLSSPLTAPAGADLARCTVTVTQENGSVQRRPLLDVATPGVRHDVDADLVPLALDLGDLALPPGYHRLSVDGLPVAADALLLVPPPARRFSAHEFGLFAPTYALRAEADWGVGSFTELTRFADLVGGWGGALAGTLPLFAAFFRSPVDPSPYLPVSRLFWNELHVDVDALPELATAPEAQQLVRSAGFRADLDRLRAQPTVDYAAVMAAKRAVLELCAESLCRQPSDRRDEFDGFVKGHSDLERYADFRAADEMLGLPWSQWSAEPGALPDLGGQAAGSRYHRYAQFVAAEQLAAVADRTAAGRAGLYLDLPVGVHPDGFDTWSHPDLFADAGVGAPPDDFFSGGQSWGFPPLHPDRLRGTGYRYLIDTYRHALGHARAIRVDHLLGLHRMFWIPPDGGAKDGAYVRYRSEELRAILAIEAARADAVIVGEDLGTVTPSIRQAMDRDGMLHCFVYQFEAKPERPLPQPRKPSMASLGSHDLPKFAAFWRGEDIDDRVDRGWLDPAAATEARTDRDNLVAAIGAAATPPAPADRDSDDAVRAGLRTCLDALAAGPATYLLVDLADLEAETAQDNRPGTGPEADNWRWRLSRPLAAIAADPAVTDVVSAVGAGRAAADTEGAGA
jgi:4-alpha-glucanotransferase